MAQESYHCSIPLREYIHLALCLYFTITIDYHFPGRRMNVENKPSGLPPSPDLSQRELFLWSWAKEEIYRSKPRTHVELEQQILGTVHRFP
jgi:hypothetical protein